MITEREIFRKRPKANPVDWVRNMAEGYGLGVDVVERVDKTGRMKYVFRDLGSEDKNSVNYPRRVCWSFNVRVQGEWREMISINQRLEGKGESNSWITVRAMVDGDEHDLGDINYYSDGGRGERLGRTLSLPTTGSNLLNSNIDSDWYEKEFDQRSRSLEVLELIGAGFLKESDLPKKIDFEATFSEFVDKAVNLDFSLPRLITAE